MKKKCNNCRHVPDDLICAWCVDCSEWEPKHPATTAIFDRMQELLEGIKSDVEKIEKLVEESRK